METKFKVGDRVKHRELGIGIVRYVDDDNVPYAVEFDSDFPGHDCDGHVPSENGHWCSEFNLTLTETETKTERANRLRKELQATPITFVPTEPAPDRTMIAAMALQGYLSIHSFQGSHNRLGGAEFDAEMAAKCAVAYADALISELQKQKP
jgi:hypothetical protein